MVSMGPPPSKDERLADALSDAENAYDWRDAHELSEALERIEAILDGAEKRERHDPIRQVAERTHAMRLMWHEAVREGFPAAPPSSAAEEGKSSLAA